MNLAELELKPAGDAESERGSGLDYVEPGGGGNSCSAAEEPTSSTSFRRVADVAPNENTFLGGFRLWDPNWALT